VVSVAFPFAAVVVEVMVTNGGVIKAPFVVRTTGLDRVIVGMTVILVVAVLDVTVVTDDHMRPISPMNI